MITEFYLSKGLVPVTGELVLVFPCFGNAMFVRQCKTSLRLSKCRVADYQMATSLLFTRCVTKYLSLDVNNDFLFNFFLAFDCFQSSVKFFSHMKIMSRLPLIRSSESRCCNLTEMSFQSTHLIDLPWTETLSNNLPSFISSRLQLLTKTELYIIFFHTFFQLWSVKDLF